MKVMAAPKLYNKPCHSGVLLKIPSYKRSADGVETEEQFWFGRTLLIFSTKGYNNEYNEWRLFVLVRLYNRAENDYTTYEPTATELLSGTRYKDAPLLR